MAQKFTPERHTTMNIGALLIAMLLIGIVLGIHFSPLVNERVIRVTEEKIKYVNVSNFVQEGKTVEMLIPAVDGVGNGVAGSLITTVRPGTGLILVNINNVLAQADTQFSARTAAQAASNFSGVDLSDLDIIYSIEVNATTVEGPSAGASMALSVLASLQNATLDPTVAITGTIDQRGNVGAVGSIEAKAIASLKEGITTFLVPSGQGTEEGNVRRVRECNVIDGINRCRVRYDVERTSIGDDLNTTIIEVSNIADAAKYFFK